MASLFATWERLGLDNECTFVCAWGTEIFGYNHAMKKVAMCIGNTYTLRIHCMFKPAFLGAVTLMVCFRSALKCRVRKWKN